MYSTTGLSLLTTATFTNFRLLATAALLVACGEAGGVTPKEQNEGVGGGGGSVPDVVPPDAGYDNDLTVPTGGTHGSGGASNNPTPDSGLDHYVPDAGGNPSVALTQLLYNFGLVYGGDAGQNGISGTGRFFVESANPCLLRRGELQKRDGESFQVNLASDQSIDFCAPTSELPLTGGAFEGVSWLISNNSHTIPANTSWEITGCGGNEATALSCSGTISIMP